MVHADPTQEEKKTNFEIMWRGLPRDKKIDILDQLQRVFRVYDAAIGTPADQITLINLKKFLEDSNYALSIFEKAKAIVQSESTLIRTTNFSSILSTANLNGRVKVFSEWADKKESDFAKDQEEFRRKQAQIARETEDKFKSPPRIVIPQKLSRYDSVEKSASSIGLAFHDLTISDDVIGKPELTYSTNSKKERTYELGFMFRVKTEQPRAETNSSPGKTGYNNYRVTITFQKGFVPERELDQAYLTQLIADGKVTEIRISNLNTGKGANFSRKSEQTSGPDVVYDMSRNVNFQNAALALEYLSNPGKQEFYVSMSLERKKQVAKMASDVLGTRVDPNADPMLLYMAVASAQRQMGMKDVDLAVGVDGLWGTRTDKQYAAYMKKQQT